MSPATLWFFSTALNAHLAAWALKVLRAQYPILWSCAAKISVMHPPHTGHTHGIIRGYNESNWLVFTVHLRANPSNVEFFLPLETTIEHFKNMPVALRPPRFYFSPTRFIQLPSSWVLQRTYLAAVRPPGGFVSPTTRTHAPILLTSIFGFLAYM
ncbi:hypothetical protein ONZ45_g18659 [Pleurotus djamor]|nr:hypothetical protein ONZ45_g18659 [Pleurotus djamor]